MTSPQDFMHMQMNLKQNQSELSDFLSDLQSWEKDIKQKDSVIKSLDEPVVKENGSGDVLPPVRNPAKKLKKKEPQPPPSVEKPAETPSEPVKSKIKSYDYRAWDKFDVDKACEDMDQSKSTANQKEDAEYETDEEAEALEVKQRARQKAAFYKEQGNKCYKSGKNKDAIIYYTKDSRYDLVIQDCSRSIELDPEYSKSYQRRGTAFLKLGKTSEAEADFKKVLEMLPGNKEAISELNKLKLVRENQSGIANTKNIVLPITKPSSKRSKVPLKRIEVEEVSEKAQKIDVSKEASFIKTKEKPKNSQVKEKSPGSEVSIPNEAKEKDPTKSSESEQLTGGNEDMRLDLRKLNERLEPDDVRTTKVCNGVSKGTAISPQISPRELPPPPASSTQFLTDFRRLTSNPELQFQYLLRIKPEDIPKLIPQSSLDAKLLNSILNLLNNQFLPNEAPIFDILSNLTKIRRFSMVTMFLSKPEKTLVSKLFDYVESNERVPESQLKSVIKLFSL